MDNINLNVELNGLELQNPIMTASGTFGFGEEYKDYVDLNRLGGVMVKGTTIKPKAGNPTPRIAETPGGVLNAIGLQNPGVDHFINVILPKIRDYNFKTIVNISGNTAEEYKELTTKLNEAEGVAALEVNISCPNVKKGGLAFGTEPKMAASVVEAVKENTDLPIITKLSPNVTDITEIAEAVEEAGTDIISLINTLIGMKIDIETQQPILANTIGGLSGPAIRPVAVRMVYQVAQSVDIPLIGMGGIMNSRDVIEFLLAGASAIAVGTANFINPGVTMEIIDELEEYLVENGYDSVQELVGLGHR
ncbi:MULTISPECIES: dihydroorotate dehydrogenase [unclassified Candidatus Frackibacter]|uniref:dihydroorotate dehydrogenase n=1 Tax=unclassified Candidatus Frackibacter TaxID=2648818 RepID=UPI00088B60DE|nr:MULTISPECIES: dihydroorotate dehydrogenase [unclassified Candidatus Frackibacter]SDC48690.1 dihydroorotate dehydrogenase (NAD+) catalytic subunit [Candidatus Frackibacter sp. WG11]SEM95754.1 dihydroorotate dehydrogenase (NAD+) catalytic subunit [Candidatus Frackibacter sp. WG12]SFL73733.1 dihydroorotate dehydrogenase (NAD+) catalytic subunit [Candidatus Frackibacter sp. WG13]